MKIDNFHAVFLLYKKLFGEHRFLRFKENIVHISIAASQIILMSRKRFMNHDTSTLAVPAFLFAPSMVHVPWPMDFSNGPTVHTFSPC